MNLFITGINGFIGTHLTRELAKHGHRVSGSVCEESMLRDQPPEAAAFFLICFGKPVDPACFKDIDLIIHTAWDTRPGNLDLNVEGTIANSQGAKEAGVPKQVFLSSYSTMETNTSEYGMAKKKLELFFSRNGHTIIRPGLVLGPGGLYARIYGMVKKYPALPLLGGGKGLMPIVLIDHLCAAMASLIEKIDRPTYNLFYRDFFSLKMVLEATKEAIGTATLLIPVPLFLILWPVALLTTLGIKLPISKSSIEGYRENTKVQLESHLDQVVDCSADNLAGLLRACMSHK